MFIVTEYAALTILFIYLSGNLPYINMPEYINRTIWFDTSSSNIRLYFNLQHDQDPNLTITSAVIKLHLRSREGNYNNAYVLDSDIL